MDNKTTETQQDTQAHMSPALYHMGDPQAHAAPLFKVNGKESTDLRLVVSK